MDKWICKLCFRTFSNGRALGGHMRSHGTLLINISETQSTRKHQCSGSSCPSSFSEGREEDEMEVKGSKSVYYELRQNPKKIKRFEDLEFSFQLDADSVIRDRVCETEMPIKRCKRSSGFDKLNVSLERDPLSSVSDTTPVEDVALCLMMLSRDFWFKNQGDDRVGSDDYGEFEYEKSRKNRSKHRCETCKKVFNSYQALGGHRASHKKIKSCNRSSPFKTKNEDLEERNGRRIHECPICFRVFCSGKALGGHRRSHFSVQTEVEISLSSKFSNNWIDLNLPAPIDKDHSSQVELSIVSNT